MPGTPRTDTREWSWDRPWPEYATITTRRVRSAPRAQHAPRVRPEPRVQPPGLHRRFGRYALIVVITTVITTVVAVVVMSVVSAGAALL